MELNGILQFIIGAVASLGGLSLIKFLFFMNPEKRKARAEAKIKELETDEKEISVMRSLVDSLKERIEQQDAKIKMLNEKVDFLYEEKHKLERENNDLVRENAMLKIQLAQAERDMCVRPDDECMKRQPPRDHCRLKRLARGYYDKFYTADELAKGEAECDEEDKELYRRKEETGNADSGVSEKPDKGE